MADDNTVEIEARLNADGVDDGMAEVEQKLQDWESSLESIHAGQAAAAKNGIMGMVLLGTGGAAGIAAGIMEVVERVNEAVTAYDEFADKVEKAHSSQLTWHEEQQKIATKWADISVAAGKTIRETTTGPEKGTDRGFMNWLEKLVQGEGVLGFGGHNEMRDQRRRLLEEKAEEAQNKALDAQAAQVGKEATEKLIKQREKEEKDRQRQAKEDDAAERRTSDMVERMGREEDQKNAALLRQIEAQEKSLDRGKLADFRRREMAGLKTPEHEHEAGPRNESIQALMSRMGSGAGSDKEERKREHEENKDMQRKREALRERWHEEDRKMQEQVLQALRDKRFQAGLLK